MSDNHANSLSKENSADGCVYEQIEIEEKIKNKTTKVVVFKKAEIFQTYYIAFSGDKKNIKALIKREPISCPSDKEHNYIEITDKEGTKSKIPLKASSEIPVKYPIKDSELLSYIWPKDSDFEKQTVIFNGCKNRTLIIKTYPDIKWGVVFSFGIDNPIGIKWKELSRDGVTYVPPKAQKTAGKVGADTRWGRGTSFEFEFSVKRNDDSKTIALKAKLEKRIQALNKILNVLKNPMDMLMKKIGGSIPAKFESVPPSLSLESQWQLCRNDKANQVGKIIELAFKADPILGIKVTIDLLGVGVYAANPGAYKVYKKIKDILNDGYDGKNFKASADIYVNLVITGEIKGDIGVSFNTLPVPAGQKKVSEIEANLDSVIGLELEAGVLIQGKVVIVIFEAYVEAGASIAGKASALFGMKIFSDNEGVFLKPKMQFEGLKVEAILKIEIGFSVKSYSNGIEKEYKIESVIIEPFDFIEFISNNTNIDPKIKLIKNE